MIKQGGTITLYTESHEYFEEITQLEIDRLKNIDRGNDLRKQDCRFGYQGISTNYME